MITVRRRTISTDKAAHLARLEAVHQEVARIVSTGHCPKCGRKLKQNLSIAGWWQCSQFGAIGFRADAEQPSCDWQGFTR